MVQSLFLIKVFRDNLAAGEISRLIFEMLVKSEVFVCLFVCPGVISNVALILNEKS